MTTTPFDTLQAEVFALTGQGRARDALDGLAQYRDPLDDEQRARVAYWRACLHVTLGEHDAALATLESLLARGDWCAPSLLERDADLAPLRGEVRFQEVLRACHARLAHEACDVKPQLLVPPRDTANQPTLLVLHGNNGSITRMTPFWADLQGLRVALAQSGQLAGPGTFNWDDEEATRTELRAHADTLGGEVLLAGFSRGAQRALGAALSGWVPARGVLAVAPSVPAPDRQEEWLFSVTQRVPVALVIGERDAFAPHVRAFEQWVRGRGVPVRVWVHALGHEHPEDWPDVRAEALTWLAENASEGAITD